MLSQTKSLNDWPSLSSSHKICWAWRLQKSEGGPYIFMILHWYGLETSPFYRMWARNTKQFLQFRAISRGVFGIQVWLSGELWYEMLCFNAGLSQGFCRRHQAQQLGYRISLETDFQWLRGIVLAITKIHAFSDCIVLSFNIYCII